MTITKHIIPLVIFNTLIQYSPLLSGDSGHSRVGGMFEWQPSGECTIMTSSHHPGGGVAHTTAVVQRKQQDDVEVMSTDSSSSSSSDSQ